MSTRKDKGGEGHKPRQRKPKPPTKLLRVQIEAALFDAIEVLAKQNRRSVAGEVELAIESRLKESGWVRPATDPEPAGERPSP